MDTVNQERFLEKEALRLGLKEETCFSYAGRLWGRTFWARVMAKGTAQRRECHVF